jgi:hypothetical protein
MTFILSAISFLTSSFGKYLMIGAAVVSIGSGIWLNGKNYATRKCEAAALRQQLANKETDLAAANEAVAWAAAAAEESEQRARDNKQKADDYEAELRSRPNGACALTDDDLRVLRGDAKSRPR